MPYICFMDRHPTVTKSAKQFSMLNKFDTDQLWVALILGLVILCLAVYRMWML
jgi:hypothetical protein